MRCVKEIAENKTTTFCTDAPNGLRYRRTGGGVRFAVETGKASSQETANLAGESPPSAAPKKMASHHFIRENVCTF